MVKGETMDHEGGRERAKQLLILGYLMSAVKHELIHASPRYPLINTP